MYWWLEERFFKSKCTLAVDCFRKGSLENVFADHKVSFPLTPKQGLQLRVWFWGFLWNVVICHQFSACRQLFLNHCLDLRSTGQEILNFFWLLGGRNSFLGSTGADLQFGSPLIGQYGKSEKVGQGKSQDFLGKTASWKHLYYLLLSLIDEGFL